jgi:hypothetical protein
MATPNNEAPALPGGMTPEERLDSLAEVLAEGFLMIAEKGGLNDLLAPAESRPPLAPGKKEAV